jgi:hypothetical protein
MQAANSMTSRLTGATLSISPTLLREARVALVAFTLGLMGMVTLSVVAPERASFDWFGAWSQRIGWSWPLFYSFGLVLVWSSSSLLVETFCKAPRRDWGAQREALLWIFESAPTIGMLTSFTSLASALVRLSAAQGSGEAAIKAFLSDFGICITSTIAGGGVSLVAFTLVKILPTNDDDHPDQVPLVTTERHESHGESRPDLEEGSA